MFFKFCEDAFAGYARPLRERIEGVCADGFFEIIRRDWMVGSIPDPRLRDVALARLLEFFEELAQAAAQHRSGAASGDEFLEAGQPV